MSVTTHKVPQITGKGNGTGGTPDAPLEYLENSVGSPASSKRPTTREPAGPTLKKNPTRQSHSRGTMTSGD